MNTKNLLKTTVAGFLLFGLSTISVKAMEPKPGDESHGAVGIPAKAMEREEHEKGGAQQAIPASIMELDSYYENWKAQRIRSVNMMEWDPDYDIWREHRALAGSIVELTPEQEALGFAHWKEKQRLTREGRLDQLGVDLVEPIKNTIQKWKKLLAILIVDPKREDIYIPYIKTRIDAFNLNEKFFFARYEISENALNTEIEDLYAKINTEELKLPEGLQAELDVLAEAFRSH